MWQSRKYQKNKKSHILETAPTHDNDYSGENWFAPQKLDTNNTSVIVQNVKK